MFKPIGRIIQKKTVTGLDRSVDAAVVVTKVTASSAGRYKATRFRNGRLTLVADSPIAAQELVLNREQITKDINELFGETIVKDLHITA